MYMLAVFHWLCASTIRLPAGDSYHEHGEVVVVRAVDGGRVVRGARYVAAFRAPAAVSIQQVKIPVCRGGVYTQREVPESDGNRLHGAPGATPICTGEQHIASSNDPSGNSTSVASIWKLMHTITHTQLRIEQMRLIAHANEFNPTRAQLQRNSCTIVHAQAFS